MVFAPSMVRAYACAVCGTNIEDHLVPDGVDCNDVRLCFRVHARCNDGVGWKPERNVAFFGERQDSPSGLEVVVPQRRSDVDARGGKDRVRHSPADAQGIHERAEVLQQTDLVFDLRAADRADERLCGPIDEAPQRAKLGFHQKAGGVGKQMREAFGRGVRAVSGCESVVHIQIAEPREAFGEIQVVAFFFGVKAEVFEQEHVAVAQLRDGIFDRRADRVVHERNGDVEPIRERLCDRAKREARIRLAVRTAQMRENDRARVVLVQPTQRWNRCIDAPVIEDSSLGYRDVEILAHQNAFSSNVELCQSPKRHLEPKLWLESP